MKKFVFMMAATAMAVASSAQTVTESKTFDNVYVGINGGFQTKTTHNAWFKNMNSNFGVRAGRWFTPVFGMAIEGNAYFNDHKMPQSKTFFRYFNANVLGTVNVSNWLYGYQGEPRTFELIPVYGLGWGHSFGTENHVSALTSKAGIDFTFNLGKEKAWQVYVEPSLNWGLSGCAHIQNGAGVKYNINKSMFQLNVGVNYKFRNSNGTHNFTIATGRNQGEIDNLNEQINNLRQNLNGKDNEISAKDKQIQDLQNALEEANKAPKTVVSETVTNLQPTVLFRQGKTVVDKSQMGNIELIAQYMKNHPDAVVEIKGYASPEGSKEINEKISTARAEAVKNVLVNTYKIKANRLVVKGMGATDKLFKQVEFNRVATFNDNNEK